MLHEGAPKEIRNTVGIQIRGKTICIIFRRSISLVISERKEELQGGYKHFNRRNLMYWLTNKFIIKP